MLNENNPIFVVTVAITNDEGETDRDTVCWSRSEEEASTIAMKLNTWTRAATEDFKRVQVQTNQMRRDYFTERGAWIQINQDNYPIFAQYSCRLNLNADYDYTDVPEGEP